MIKFLSLLFFIFYFTSCKTNEQEKIQALETELDSLKNKKAVSSTGTGLDSSRVERFVPKKEEKSSVKPIGTYKTIPQIMKHLFSNGSKKQELIKVQGLPEITDDENNREVWYYGNCKVYFKGDLVEEVINNEECIKYAGFHDLINSDDKIEKEFGRILLNRMANNISFNLK